MAVFRRVHAVLFATLVALPTAVFVSSSASATCSPNGTANVVCSGVTSGPSTAGATGGAPVTIHFLSDFVADGSPGNEFSIQISTTGSALLTFDPGASTGSITTQGPIASTSTATRFNATLPSGASFGGFNITSASLVTINIGGTSDTISANRSLPGSLITVSGTVNKTIGSSSQPAIFLGSGTVLVNPGGQINSGNSSAPAIKISNAGTVTNAGTVNGQVAIGGGRVELRPGGVFSSTVSNTGGTATFVLGGGGADTFDLSQIGSKYRGFSSLGKEGTSTWTVTGTNAGPAWTVSGGTLLLAAGANLGDVTVNGGTLGGDGTIGATTINSGGTLAPGNNSVGIITAQSNLTFNSGSNYLIGATQGAAGRTNVNGIATLTGATVQVTALAPLRAQTFTILNATGGLDNTTFAGVSATNSIVINPRLTYDANNVFLTVDTTQLSVPAGASSNGATIVTAINNAILGGVTLPSGFNTLFDLNGSALANVLDQLSGGGGASGGVQAGNQMTNSFLTMLLNGFSGGRGAVGGFGAASGYAPAPVMSAEAADAYAAIYKAAPRRDDAGWTSWGSAYGGQSNARGDAAVGSSDTRASTWGLAAGFDRRVSPSTVVGMAFGGGSTNWNLANGLGHGRGEVFQTGVYASHQMGAAYVSAAATYALHSVTTDRTVLVAGTDSLTADFTAHNVGGRVEAGWRFLAPGGTVGVTPYAAAQVQAFFLPGYGETATTGSNQFALAYDRRTATTTRSELGAWFDTRQLTGNGWVNLFGRLAWAHDWRSDNSVTAAFQSLGGSGFIVNGATPPSNIGLVTAGIESRVTKTVTVSAKFDGEFAGGYQSYAGTGTVRYSW